MSIVADKVKTKLKDRAAAAPEKSKPPKVKKPTKKAIRKQTKDQEEKPLTKKEEEADHKAQGFAVVEKVKAKVKETPPAIGDSGILRKVESMKGRMER
jgi:hypothetical protein